MTGTRWCWRCRTRARPTTRAVFSHHDAGAGSSVWAVADGRTYLRGTAGGDGRLVRLLLLHDLRGRDRGCAARDCPTRWLVQNDWTGIAVEHADLERLLQREGATGAPVAVGPQELRPRVHPPVPRSQGRAGRRLGSPLRHPDQRVAVAGARLPDIPVLDRLNVRYGGRRGGAVDSHDRYQETDGCPAKQILPELQNDRIG